MIGHERQEDALPFEKDHDLRVEATQTDPAGSHVSSDRAVFGGMLKTAVEGTCVGPVFFKFLQAARESLRGGAMLQANIPSKRSEQRFDTGPTAWSTGDFQW